MKRKHGHGSVEEHPKGSGRYRFRVRVDGELRTIVKDMSQPEAQEAADAYVRIRRAEEIRAGVTLTQFGAGFLDRRELGKKHRSAHKDRSRWKTRVDADPIGALAVATLKRIDFVGWRDRMIKAGYAAQTIRNTINLVKVALDEALDRELLPANPIADLKLPRGVCATKEEDLSGVLLPEEQTALLAAVPAHERALVAICLLLGLRWSEGAWLRWVDVKADHVLVRTSTKGGPTKSGKPRRVPLSPAVEAALADARGRYGHLQFCFGPPRGNRPNGWKRWIRAAGIDRRVRFHDLRHTTATSLLAGWWGRRWSLDEVRQMLGHSSVQVTERYARLLDETLQNAADSTLFPHGGAFAPSSENDLSGSAFLNRWPDVRVVPGAPNDSARLALPPAGSLGTSREQSLSESDRQTIPKGCVRIDALPRGTAFQLRSWLWFHRGAA